MTCNSVNIPSYKCEDIKSPFGPDPLDKYLIESSTDINGNVTLKYIMPAPLFYSIKPVNKNVEFYSGGIMEDGRIKAIAYIKKLKPWQK